MNIQLVHSFVKHLELKNTSSDDDIVGKEVVDDSDKGTFGLGFSVDYHKERDHEFMIMFEVTVNLPSNFILEVEYMTIFETSEPIDEQFRTSHFPVVNAPAIAFPFLRSFVATFLLNAGHHPVIFPSINFTQFEKEQEGKFYQE